MIDICSWNTVSVHMYLLCAHYMWNMPGSSEGPEIRYHVLKYSLEYETGENIKHLLTSLKLHLYWCGNKEYILNPIGV